VVDWDDADRELAGGSINDTYDLLAKGSASIVGEVIVPVHHALLALPGTHAEDIHRVISHPQALAQCQDYLERWTPKCSRCTTRPAPPASSPRLRGAAAGAGSGRMAGSGRRQLPPGAGDTEFWRGVPTPQGQKSFHTMKACGVEGREQGHVVNPFAERNLNLSKLESRPLGGRPWEYRFYLDVEVGESDESFRAALEEFREFTAELKVLGSYPRWPDQPDRG
jgi:hypothetical protein